MSTDPLRKPPWAAEYLNVQVQTLAMWRSSGRHDLPFIKVGRRVMYRQSDLDAWLESRRVTHTGQLPAIG